MFFPFVVVHLGLLQSYFFLWVWRMCACDCAVLSQLSAGMRLSLNEAARLQHRTGQWAFGRGHLIYLFMKALAQSGLRRCFTHAVFLFPPLAVSFFFSGQNELRRACVVRSVLFEAVGTHSWEGIEVSLLRCMFVIKMVSFSVTTSRKVFFLDLVQQIFFCLFFLFGMVRISLLHINYQVGFAAC